MKARLVYHGAYRDYERDPATGRALLTPNSNPNLPGIPIRTDQGRVKAVYELLNDDDSSRHVRFSVLGNNAIDLAQQVRLYLSRFTVVIPAFAAFEPDEEVE